MQVLAAIANLSMQKTILILLLILGLLSCGHNSMNNQKSDTLSFTVSIHPSFDETAKIILSKVDTLKQLKCIMFDGNRNDRHADTFYSKTILLSDEQFNKFDSTVIQKTRIKQTPQHEGCCDGISFQFIVIHNDDTLMLHFGNLSISSDTTACRIINQTLDNLALLYKDSIITDYFNDVKSYIYDSVEHIHYKDNRAINKLRKIEYSR
jgi:hypothetical protein